MTRNERQRDLVQTLNGADINIDRLQGETRTGNGWVVGSARTSSLAGYTVAEAAGSVIDADDPTDYANHTDAVRAVRDTLQDAGVQGRVRIPHELTDGSLFTFDSTVTFDGDAGGDVVPVGDGPFGRGGPYIDVTINNGDPCMLVKNMNLEGTEFGGFQIGPSSGVTDAEVLRTQEISRANIRNFYERGMGGGASPSASGSFVIDSDTFNSLVYNIESNGIPVDFSDQDVSGKRVLAFEDTLATGNPGETAIIGMSTYADPTRPVAEIVYNDTSGADNIRFVASRWEGAGGTAAVLWNSGDLKLTNCQFGRQEGGADGLRFVGGRLFIDSTTTCDVLGDGGIGMFINAGRTSRTDATHVEGGTGDGYEVRPNANDVTFVPHPDTVTGTTNYFADAADSVKYPTVTSPT